MTQTSSTPDSSSTSYPEIDLARYARLILSWWREILALALIVAVVALVLGLALRAYKAPVYETSTDVIMARVVSSVNLVETFRTTTEDVALNSAGESARREALVNLVDSGAIAALVIAELGDRLSVQERDPAILIDMVSAVAPLGSDNRTISDLIRITVRANDPDKAAAIANAWARFYVAHINSVYNQVPLEIVESVELDLQDANAEYLTAQQAFEAFIANNEIYELQNEIDQKMALRTNYQEAQKALTASVVEQDRAARTKLFGDLVTAQTNAVYQVFDQQVQEKTQRLAQLYHARELAQRQLAQAENLRQQIEDGASTSSPGTLLALQLLKTQVYASVEGSTLPIALNLDLGVALTGDETDPIPDVAALITTLEQYSNQLRDDIALLSADLLTGVGYNFVDHYSPEALTITASGLAPTATVPITAPNELAAAIYARYTDLFAVGDLARHSETGQISGEPSEISNIIDDLAQELNTLEAALAGEQSRQQLLMQQRDQAWSTYDTLSNKVVELRLARTAANSEVRLGNVAVAPHEPVQGVSLALVTVSAGALGIIFAILMVSVADLMNWRLWSFRRNSPAGEKDGIVA